LTKSIDTLVEDIYALFDKPENWNPDPENIKAFGQRLATHIGARASLERGAPTLRLSNLGSPARKLWFTVNRPDAAEKLRPETKIKFLFGDILEELLLFLSKEAGHDVKGEQEELVVNGVVGHRDAVIDGRLVDAKSASSYSYQKFKDHGLPGNDPFGYVDQLGSYLHASKDDNLLTDKDVASFLVIDKQHGKLCLDTYGKTGIDYDALVEEKRQVLALPEPPEEFCYNPVPEGKSGNMKLPVECSYCPFKWECRTDLRGFLYASGPVYLTKVTREPKVPEIDRDGNYVMKEVTF
jgi:hypothetical protein